MFMIMEVSQSFSRKESQGRRAKSQGASLGAAHVEIPASVAGSKTWREMATHGTYF
jgi:hypothetical protein